MPEDNLSESSDDDVEKSSSDDSHDVPESVQGDAGQTQNYQGNSDDFPDECVDIINTESWCIAGASVIGRMHKIDGTHREDAFKIDDLNGWYIMAVADGAGSRTLSRVGSNLLVNSAIDAMRKKVECIDSISSDEEFAKNSMVIIFDGINSAHKSLLDESKSRNINIRDLGSTLLLVAYHPNENSLDGGGIIHVAQVGDGIIAAVLDGEFELLSDPDVGEDSGTVFVTSMPCIEDQQKSPWINRVKTYYVKKKKVDQIITLTDGLSEDFYPYEKYLPDFLKNVMDILIETEEKEVKKRLLDLLNHEKRGSFDDKTLAIIYPKNWCVKGI